MGDLSLDFYIEVLDANVRIAKWIAPKINRNATEVLDKLFEHSILYVMRPNLNAEHSGLFVRFLEMIGNLRSKRYDVELNYDLDITRCYYALRYTFQVAFADNISPGNS